MNCGNFPDVRLLDAKRKASAGLGALIVMATAASAQPDERFVSVYGGFSINLPKITTITRGFRDTETRPPSSGTIYAWDTGAVVYTVRYSSPPPGSARSTSDKIRLEYENRAVRETVKQYGGTILSEKDADFGHGSGTEILAKIGTGTMTARNFVAKGGHAYSLQAIARDPKYDAEARRLIGTFALIDGERIIEEKVAILTPEGFPETSERIWAPDRSAENLRGPVKQVTERRESLSAGNSTGGVLHSSRMAFSADGSQTSAVRFDSAGMPSEVEVFGFEEGSRVSKTRSAEDVSVVRKSIHRKRFDASGRPFRAATYDTGGVLILRTVFERPRGSLVTYLSNDTVAITTRSIVNSFGDPVITRFERTVDGKDRVVELRYRYGSRDRYGNWTRRTVLRRSDDGKWEEQSVEYREIGYYLKK